jgi:hypothetical protein
VRDRLEFYQAGWTRLFKAVSVINGSFDVIKVVLGAAEKLSDIISTIPEVTQSGLGSRSSVGSLFY